MIIEHVVVADSNAYDMVDKTSDVPPVLLDTSHMEDVPSMLYTLGLRIWVRYKNHGCQYTCMPRLS